MRWRGGPCWTSRRHVEQGVGVVAGHRGTVRSHRGGGAATPLRRAGRRRGEWRRRRDDGRLRRRRPRRGRKGHHGGRRGVGIAAQLERRRIVVGGLGDGRGPVAARRSCRGGRSVQHPCERVAGGRVVVVFIVNRVAAGARGVDGRGHTDRSAHARSAGAGHVAIEREGVAAPRRKRWRKGRFGGRGGAGRERQELIILVVGVLIVDVGRAVSRARLPRLGGGLVPLPQQLIEQHNRVERCQ